LPFFQRIAAETLQLLFSHLLIFKAIKLPSFLLVTSIGTNIHAYKQDTLRIVHQTTWQIK
jgi:hypothetical protein